MVNTVPLKRNYEFIRLYKNGKFFVGKFLTLYALPNRLQVKRLGISISKKFGKSVSRNRLRRLIKENYRFYEDFVHNSFDLVFVARSSGIMPEYNDIKREMKFLLKRLKVFDQEKWDCLKNC